jgi:DNA-directed RNA polymerase specialized sigma24 family protein
MSGTRNHQQQARPTDAPPAGTRLQGDESRLFITYASRLRRIVDRAVNTGAANLDDACAFAWAQLVSRQPRRETVFQWLVTVAIHEAIRLDRRDRRTHPIDDNLAAHQITAPAGAEERLLLLETIEGLDAIHAVPDARARRQRRHDSARL